MSLSEATDVLLVIVGAGASNDCIPGGKHHALVRLGDLPQFQAQDVVPPMTHGLLRGPLSSHIMGRFPAASNVVAALHRQMRTESPDSESLEQAFAEYQDSHAHTPEGRRHVLAMRFYLRDLLWTCSNFMDMPQVTQGRITNYTHLVGVLSDWANDETHDRHVCFVSFNYDLVLDRACGRYWQHNFTDPDSYLALPRVSILKPHGSVQWYRPLRGQPSLDPSTADARAIQHASEDPDQSWLTRTVLGTDDAATGHVAQPGIPALGLPMAGRTKFAWPPEHQAHLEQLRGKVRRVLTVGWRGAEPHFNKYFGELINTEGPEPRLLVVTGGSPGPAKRDADHVHGAIGADLDPPALGFEAYHDGFDQFRSQGFPGLPGWLLRDAA